MKFRFAFIGFLFSVVFLQDAAAQAGMWTWKKGSSAMNSNGSYGVQGIGSPFNEPPARYEAAQWTDLNGNFWMYGGGFGMQRYSDLWKYDPALNEWTWMHGSNVSNSAPVYGTQGIPAPANTPGGVGFGACTWTDPAGNLWLYGGDNGTTAPYSDLWRYDPSTNMWTWVKGQGTPGALPVYGTQLTAAVTNTPGALEETACTWVDQTGRLWLFGGTPSGIGVAYDALWMYDPAVNMWTWMKGSSAANASPVYGTLNVAAAANTPGARWCYTSWTDNAGNLWMFGGITALSPLFMDFYNDLWMYNIATNMWTWKGGSQLTNQPGVYGTKCIPAAGNIPGGRGETRACWTDSCGNFWLFGGRDQNINLFNDFWRYEPATGLWTWMSGANTPNQAGVYGTQNLAAPANVPGGRAGNVSWGNADGLWLFGGEAPAGQYNDLWLYTPDTISVQITATPLSGCAPLQVNFIPAVQGCGSLRNLHWTFGDPASGSADTSVLLQPSHLYTSPGTYTATLIAADCQGRTDTALVQITVQPGITLQTTVNSSMCVASGSATVAASGGSGVYTYVWQPAVSSSQSATGLAPGSYTVTVADASGCSNSDTAVVLLADSLQISLGSDTVICFENQLQISATGSVANYLWSTGQTTTAITVTQTGIYSVSATSGICTDTDSMLVRFIPQPVSGSVPSLCETGIAEITVSASSGSAYLWSTGDTVSTLSANAPGQYTVLVTNEGCLFADTFLIPDFTGSSALYFPNSFTPNNDGINETFKGYGEGVLEYDLQIFNRWGERIFHTDNFNAEWDGKRNGQLVQEDVYVWVATYRLNCDDSRGITRRGHVTVIR
jgi:gliding motility-associated-like protein